VTSTIKKMLFLLMMMPLPAALSQGQENIRFSVSPIVSFTEFGKDFGFNPAFGFGAVFRFHPDSELSLALSGSITGTEVDFSMISETGHLPVTVSMLQAQLDYRLLESFVDLLGSVSAGVLHTHAESYRLSLGALGSQVVPSRDESFATASAGMIIRRQLGSIVAVYLEPRVFFSSRDSRTFSFTSIAGGISVGIR
jgi:hypothetical protein